MKPHRFLFIISLLFFILFLQSCKDKTTDPVQTDTEKPTVVILYPANGAEVKADTIYKITGVSTSLNL